MFKSLDLNVNLVIMKYKLIIFLLFSVDRMTEL